MKYKTLIKKIAVTSTLALSVAPLAVQNLTVFATNDKANQGKLSECKDLLNKVKDQLKKETDLSKQIKDARDKASTANDLISNQVVKIADLKSKKSDTQTDLKDNQVNLKDAKKQKSEAEKTIKKIYLAKQSQNNNQTLLPDFNLTKAVKNESLDSTLASLLKTTKKDLARQKNKVKDLSAQVDQDKTLLTDYDNQIDEANAIKDNQSQKYNNDELVKNAFNPASLSQVQDLKHSHDDLQSQFDKLSDEIVKNAKNESKANLKEEKDILSDVQKQLSKSSSNLSDLTGLTLDNIKVDMNKVEKALNSINTSSDNDNLADNNSDDLVIAPTETANSATASAIVKEALKYVGVPYVWGGTTPSGFDCSGLVQYVFRKSGISLPRVSQAQSTVGKLVSLNSLQPGDLLFWGGVGTAHHVAIYIGNSEFVQAPEPGQNVKITKLSWYRPDFAKRVL